LLQSIVNGVTLSLFYMLVSVGLALLYGMSNIVYMAHGVTYMLGGLLAYYLIMEAGIPWLLAVLIIILIFGLFGPLVERVFFRRVRAIGTSSMVVSLGLLFLLEGIALFTFGLRTRPVSSGFSGSISVFNATLTFERMYMILGAGVLLAVLQWFLVGTKYGKAMRATVQNKTGALLQGISDDRIAGMAFCIGMALAGAAGALVAPLYNVQVSMYYEATIWPFLIMAVGGLGSIPGCIIAAFIFGFAQAFVSTFIGPVIGNLVLYGLVTVFLAFRPQGLIGESRAF